jgi:nitroreductase
LKWRYAVKQYSDKEVSETDLNAIIDAINLSASSAGMQPYRLFVLKDESLRKKLGAVSFNRQIVEASHLLAFAAYENVDQEKIDGYIQHVANVREIPVTQLADFKKSLELNLLSRTDEENFIWSSRQAYIALGTGLIAAAELKIDATPMEGFDSLLLDELLDLKKQGLKSVVLLSIGYRDEERDIFAKLKKVRLPKEQFAKII